MTTAMDIKMMNIKDDKQYRATPEDGHVLILMQTKNDLRTFKDYPNLLSCLDGLTVLFEAFLEKKEDADKNNYDIKQLWSWIDSFDRMEMYIYDRELARYKKNTRTELKEHFVSQIKKIDEQGHQRYGSSVKGATTNGIRVDANDVDDGIEDVDGNDDDEEIWD